MNFFAEICDRVDVNVHNVNFNTTLGTDRLCYNNAYHLNVTYNVPISKYMSDKSVFLTFT